MKKFILFFLLFAGFQIQAQNFVYDHELVLMDSTFDQNEDLTIRYFIDYYKKIIDDSLQIVIGECQEDLNTFSPQSPLSNLITDLLLEFGNDYWQGNGTKIDFSFMNFGGIRSMLPKGAIKIANIFTILPFENTVTLVRINGKNLKEVLTRFTEYNSLPASGLEIIFRNNRFISATVNQKAIIDEQEYIFITNSYVAHDGEEILKKSFFTEIIETEISVRDAIIFQIKKHTQNGEILDAKIDNRVIVEPTR